MPQSYTSLIYHIVFGTKNGLPLIAKDLAAGLHAYMAGILKHLDGRPILIGGVENHVHILTILSQKRSVEDVLRDLKANSSRWVHQTFRERSEFAWQDGYSAFTVSVRGIPQVKGYIAKQEAHHREVPFAEELREFLKMHEIAFDERYI